MLTAASLGGCGSGSTQGGPAPASKAGLGDGLWAYHGGPGKTSMEIALWQVGGDSLTGRLLHWMSGDMGMTPRQPVVLSGMIEGTKLWFVIPLTPSAAAVRIEGTLAGDTLRVTSATTGGDDNGLAGSTFHRIGPAPRP